MKLPTRFLCILTAFISMILTCHSAAGQDRQQNELTGEMLVEALVNRNQDEVLRLIELGIDVNSRGDRNQSDIIYSLKPLHIAALFGYYDIVEALLSRGADVHARVNYYCGFEDLNRLVREDKSETTGCFWNDGEFIMWQGHTTKYSVN